MGDSSDETDDATLSDYGAQTAPRARHSRTVTLGTREVGWFGRLANSGEVVYATDRNAEEHRYHGNDYRYDLPFEGEGHALSLALYPRIEGTAGKVFIVEHDTGDVFQFSHSQFVEYGTVINVDGDEPAHPERGYEKDPQSVLPLDAAVHRWENHAGDFRAKAAGFE